MPAWKRSTLVNLSVFSLLCTVSVLPTRPGFAGVLFLLAALTCTLASVFIFRLRRAFGPRRGFGLANQVTLCRLGIAIWLLCVWVAGGHTQMSWLTLALAGAALALDGIDGAIARRTNTCSAFGARFDMETDALMVLVLCVGCIVFEKAGWWIILAGLYRYLFVAAGAFCHWLRPPLPASRRRQTACVAQTVSLLLCLLPLWAPPWSSGIALTGLVILSASFAVDIIWLYGRRDQRVLGLDIRAQ